LQPLSEPRAHRGTACFLCSTLADRLPALISTRRRITDRPLLLGEGRLRMRELAVRYKLSSPALLPVGEGRDFVLEGRRLRWQLGKKRLRITDFRSQLEQLPIISSIRSHCMPARVLI